MQAADLLSRLESRVVVCDGATGTMLYAAGFPLDRVPPEANISHPDLVRSIHSAYLAAGVEILQTNTFGASRHRLARYGDDDHVAEINQAGVRIAREALAHSGASALVAGSVGPATPPGVRGRLATGDAGAALEEQIETLAAAGVDLLVLETFGDLSEMSDAVRAAQRICRVPIVAQMTFVDDNRTLAGDAPDEVAGALEELGVAVIGANCTLGPQGLLEVLRQLARSTSLPLSAQPNAGLPTVADGHLRYTVDGDYFARYARRFVEAGATIVGGCCGTTPEHMQAVAAAVADLQPLRHPLSTRESRLASQTAVAPSGGGSRLRARLAERQFAIICETQPSHGGDADRALREATRLHEAGADAILVTSSTSPRAQMSAATLAFLFTQRLQIETILAASAWDKSAIALQADLLGAHAFGIRNVLCRTDAPPPLGDYPQVRMWGVDSAALVEILHSLNEGRDANSIPTGKPTSFFIGARINPTSENPEQELAAARRKIAAGAGFLVTRPIYDIDAYVAFLNALGPIDVPILLGVTPLRDFNHAEYLRYEVPGVSLPDATLVRMQQAGERGADTGMEIARELIRDVRGRADGVLLGSASGSSVELVQLLESLPR